MNPDSEPDDLPTIQSEHAPPNDVSLQQAKMTYHGSGPTMTFNLASVFHDLSVSPSEQVTRTPERVFWTDFLPV
jgi:hypothetical protein